MGEFDTVPTPRITTLAVAALSVALLASACTTTDRRTLGRSFDIEGPVLLLGDSILVGARDAGSLSEGLTADGWIPETIAEESKTVWWALEQIRLRAAVPDTVVVVMGANPGTDPAPFPDEATALLDALVARGADRVVWVPPFHVDGRYEPKTDALAELASSSLHVALGWPELAEQNEHWFSGDGLHMTAEGYQALASFIRSELSGAPAG